MKYIIDTDPGIDDAMAIMLAVKAGLDIVALTTVAGNSTIEHTTRNARYVLDLLNRNDIPVYSGSAKPLKRDLTLGVVHGINGLEGIDQKSPVRLTHNAIEKILGIVSTNKEITIIALGPLTNIAKAIQKDPKAMSKIKEIVIMGGAIRVPGNKNRVAEFNMFVDPEAADIVLKFPIKKTLIPLDACNRVNMRLSDFQKIKGELKKNIMRIAKPYMNNIYREEGVYSAVMYDPLTVYYVLKPRACIIRKYDILVETKGDLTRGMTVADLRNKPERKNMIDVVEKVSTVKFKKDFIGYLSART